jgi:catechol 2,3-dioxygenase-like lactoylglutathione lyase family enzyme
MFQTAVPVLRVANADAATAFYRDRLGFAVLSSWRPNPRAVDPCYMTMVRDGVRLHIHSFGSQPIGAGAAYLIVDNVDALHAELVSQGVPIPHEPIDQTWGVREIVVRDPDGNVLTIGQRLASG